MFKRPIVLGINAKEAKQTASEGPAKLLEAYGRNLGNIAFLEGLQTSLAGAERVSYAPSADVLANADVMVIAAANWLNHYDDFGWLAHLIERNGLPVVLVGVGAQAGNDHAIPRLKDGTRRFLDVVRDRTTTISTRGNFSSEVLEAYGITESVPTGCPSLLLAGATAPPFKKVSSVPDWSSTALHSTRHSYNAISDPVQAYLYRQALKHGADLVIQSELPELFFATNSDWDDEASRRGGGVLEAVYGESADTVRTYLEAHAKAYLDIESWRDALAKKQFCLGSRIHGTVIALLAGTPALLVVHDSRTAEMATAMAIPSVAGQAIDLARDLNLENLFERSAAYGFVSYYERYRLRFFDFFEANRLAVDRRHFGLGEQTPVALREPER